MEVSFMCCSKAAAVASKREPLAEALRIDESGLRMLPVF
jgi:hypothetical protein